MRNLFIFPLLLSFLLFAGCASNGSNGDSAFIVPYFEDEQYSDFTGEIERYVAPQPDEYGYTNHYYTIMGFECPDGSEPEVVTFNWENPSTQEVYLAGSPSEPFAHYRATNDAVFTVKLRVDYVCEGRSEISEAESQRKGIMLYFAEEGMLYEQEAMATCPGDYLPTLISEKDSIGKGTPVGADSDEGWFITSHKVVVAEPYDYAINGCGKYDEHWLNTYMRESVNGTHCEIGECRGFWHTFECPKDNAEGVRREVYAGKNCISVSQQKDFRSPQEWYNILEIPEFPSAETTGFN